MDTMWEQFSLLKIFSETWLSPMWNTDVKHYFFHVKKKSLLNCNLFIFNAKITDFPEVQCVAVLILFFNTQTTND